MNPASNPDEPGVLDRAVAESDRWVEETGRRLRRGDTRIAYSVLRAVLHAVRDYLPFDEAVKLANHLPPLLRGMYYEGWKSEIRPLEGFTRESFLQRVGGADPEKAAVAVFQALRTLTEGKMAHRSSGWPRFLLELSVLGPVGTDSEVPSSLDPTRMKAAIERAEIDGAPIDVPPASTPASPGSVFDKSVQKTNDWIKQLMRDNGWNDRLQAFTVLTSVLETLRDRLGRDEALDLGAQLPETLRGFYFENWDPHLNPRYLRTLEDFRSAVAERLTGVFDIEPDRAAAAVFRLLVNRIPGGEMAEVRSRLPKELRKLWPGGDVKAARAHAGPRAGLRKPREEIRLNRSRLRPKSRR